MIAINIGSSDPGKANEEQPTLSAPCALDSAPETTPTRTTARTTRICVDPLLNHGWRMYGKAIPSCHMFADGLDLEPLHELAKAIGLQRRWFQGDGSTPHYDLTPSKRAAAVAAGAVELTIHEAVKVWQATRAAARALDAGQDPGPCLQVERDARGEPAVCTLTSGHASAHQDQETGHAWELA